MEKSKSFRWEPFLWIHLTGVFVLPLLLECVWLGLAIADSVVPFPVELGLLILVGIVPLLWMQWSRPFDIFSLLLVAIAPQHLDLDQRRILSLFKTPKNRVLSLAAASILLGVLWQLFQLAPLATTAASIFPSSRVFGLLFALFTFLMSHLFLQVPISVLGVLLTSEQEFEKTQPLAVETIPRELTILGLRVQRILPFRD